MSITQKSLIADMESTIKDEVLFLIEYKGYTMDNETDFKKRIRQMKKDYNLLLSTMEVKKTVNVTLYTILSDLSVEAYDNNNSYYESLLLMYEKKEMATAI